MRLAFGTSLRTNATPLPKGASGLTHCKRIMGGLKMAPLRQVKAWADRSAANPAKSCPGHGRLTVSNRVRINTLALAARLPTVHSNPEQLEGGGLISYGPNVLDQFRRAAEIVDKVLRGGQSTRRSGRGTDQVRVGDQFASGKASRSRCSLFNAIAGRQGDRITVRISGTGTKRQFLRCSGMSEVRCKPEVTGTQLKRRD